MITAKTLKDSEVPQITWLAPVSNVSELEGKEPEPGNFFAAMDKETHLLYVNRGDGKGWDNDPIQVRGETRPVEPQTHFVRIVLKDGSRTNGYVLADGATVLEIDSKYNYTGMHYKHQIIGEEVICTFKL